MSIHSHSRRISTRSRCPSSNSISVSGTGVSSATIMASSSSLVRRFPHTHRTSSRSRSTPEMTSSSGGSASRDANRASGTALERPPTRSIYPEIMPPASRIPGSDSDTSLSQTSFFGASPLPNPNRRPSPLSTRTPPKTRRSLRGVHLPHSAVSALLGHREIQNAERARANGSWQDRGLVFPNTLGGYADYTNLMPRHFKPLLKKAGLPDIRFHDLRHTCATLLLTKGVHPKVVSEMLGHSSVSITLDVYSHVIPGLGDAAALAMEDALS